MLFQFLGIKLLLKLLVAQGQNTYGPSPYEVDDGVPGASLESEKEGSRNN